MEVDKIKTDLEKGSIRNKIIYSINIIYIIVVVGLYLGVENFKDSVFYVLLGFGFMFPVVYFLFNQRNTNSIISKLEKFDIPTDEPRIVESKLAPKEVKEYAKKIALVEGFALKEIRNYFTLSYGDRVKRSVAVLYMVDEYGGFGGGDTWTFLMSLSEPDKYSLLKYEADFKTRQLYAESLANVTSKPQEVREIIREVRVDNNTGERTTTEETMTPNRDNRDIRDNNRGEERR